MPSRLWPLTNEVIANDSPHSLKELEELLIVRCRKLLQQQELGTRINLLSLVAND